MTFNIPSQQPMPQTPEQILHQAVAHHQAGQLQEAGELYLTILQAHPNHPEANHYMGILAVQIKQPASGLPYFMAALDAEPTRGQYWLSYIDALFQAGQPEDAREVLALAQQQGLQGKEVDSLAARLEGSAQAAGQPDTEDHQATKESPPGSSTTSQSRKKNLKTKPQKTDESAKRPTPRPAKNPSHKEINALVTLFNQGRYAEAAILAQAMTVRFPLHWVGWKMLGVVFMQLGRSADALAPMQKAAALLPGDAEAHNNLGTTLHDLCRLDEAEASYQQALRINPEYAHAQSNLGATLHDLNRLDEAEASYRRALQINPEYAKAHSNLGTTLHDLGRLDEAEASYRRALQINPEYAEAHYNLGITLKDLGRLDEAEASYRRALEIEPAYAEAHSNLGVTLQDLGRLIEAEASYRQALEIKPDYFEAHCSLGAALKDLGRLNEAEVSLRRALQIKPDFAEVHNNLGTTLQNLGRIDEAETSLRRALQIKPDFAEAHSNLGNTLKDLGRLDEAEASHRRALQIMPNFAKALSNLGTTLHDLGRLGEAEANYRMAMEADPDHAATHSNLLFCLTQNATVNAETLFSEHCRFGELFETAFRTNRPQFSNSRDPDRTLRIGFVSSDFYNHAVANFIEPVLAHLSAYPQLSLHAYSNNTIEDAVTQRIREHFADWHFIVGLSDAALAEKIRADNIDILIDLSGHTAKNRLLTFARKPAPVQASWMGYPGTTGLRSMDYYLADRFFLPPGQFDDQFTEKIVRMPAGAPFLPFQGAPPVNTLPALINGHVTFGSFNRLSKLSRPVIALWSQLLRALPDSRMVLAGMPQDRKCDTVIEWFAQEGIALERLNIHPRSGMDSYLTLHHQVDICLDTFPYNGGTTTFHALWMGVPTLTLAGSTAASRSGASILGHAGLEAFVANDAADYVRKGLSWAGNLAALSDIRAGLRERFANSAMGQPTVAAAGLEHALRVMWQRWCAGLPAESFEVSSQEISSTMPETCK